MRATDLLRRQHRHILGLLKRAEGSDAPNERRLLVRDLADEVNAHSGIESDVFYPAVRAIGVGKAVALVDESLEEHAIIEALLQELVELDPADARFGEKMTVLAELLAQHIEEEEQVMFPMAESLGDEELHALGDHMRIELHDLRGAVIA